MSLLIQSTVGLGAVLPTVATSCRFSIGIKNKIKRIPNNYFSLFQSGMPRVWTSLVPRFVDRDSPRLTGSTTSSWRSFPGSFLPYECVVFHG